MQPAEAPDDPRQESPAQRDDRNLGELIQELRDLIRKRRELTREIVRHTQRIQATLEEANIKLTSVISDILGLSGRRILRAIVAGESDPHALADLRHPRLACPHDKLIAALAAVVCMGALSLVGSSPFNVFIATFVGCGVGVCLTKRS